MFIVSLNIPRGSEHVLWSGKGPLGSLYLEGASRRAGAGGRGQQYLHPRRASFRVKLKSVC